MNIRFITLVEREWRDAFDWYERITPGLGYKFLADLDQVVTRLKYYPESCSIIENEIRRIIFNRFPYCLWYVIEEETVVVYAVAHMHREPHYWCDRLCL